MLNNIERAAALSVDPANEAQVDRLLHVVVVGGGPTGVELSAELADFCRCDVARRYGEALARRCRITLVEALPRCLSAFDPSLADVATGQLTRSGVAVRTATAVSAVHSAKTATIEPSVPRSATAEDRARAKAQAEPLEFGALVWAAGVTQRPITARLGAKLGQEKGPRRGLRVDAHLRVATDHPAAKDAVYAIGDCADSGLAPTAQVASQQGRYLGRALSKTDPEVKPFAYKHAGALAFVGSRSAVAQLAAPPTSKTAAYFIWRGIHGASATPTVGDQGERALTGGAAFLFWRALYFAQLISSTNRFNLLQDWLNVEINGRDVVVPTSDIQRQNTR